MPQFEYQTARLRLVPSAPALAGQVLDYYQRNRDFLQATEPLRDAAFYTTAFQRQALEQDEKDAEAGTNRRFWLALNGEDRLIGNVALNNIVMGAFCSAFLSYRLDAGHVNQGLVTEAVTKLIAVAFREWGLHRLEANIMPGNAPSRRVVEKLGFRCEGLARRYLKIQGVWEDHVHMVLLNE